MSTPLSIRPGAHPDECLLAVRAQPGARRRGVLGLWNGQLRVALTAPAREGRANEELLTVLAEALGVRRSALELVGGHAARQKVVRVALPPLEARRRAERAAHAADA